MNQKLATPASTEMVPGVSVIELAWTTMPTQQKAARARADGSFSKSLVPVRDQNGIILLDHDEFIRADSTLEGDLGKLKPSFEMMGQMGFDATALRVYSHGANQPCTRRAAVPGS